MKWFEHQTDCELNKKFQKLEMLYQAKGGDGFFAAYGRVWRLYEIIGRLGEDRTRKETFDLPPDFTHDLLAYRLKCSMDYLVEFLSALAEVGLIDKSAWGNEQRVFAPKLQERAGHYTKRKIRNTLSYRGKDWQRRVKEIRERDKVCRICGKNPEENGRALEVHHLKPWREFNGDIEKANHPDNLIAVCLSCHNKLRHSHDNDTTLARLSVSIAPPHSHSQTHSQDKQASACVAEAAAPSGDVLPPETDVSVPVIKDGGNGNKPKEIKFGPAGLVQLWNDLGCRPLVSELTDERRKKASLRIRKRGDPDWWNWLFEKVEGLNKPWLTFDFLMRSDTNCLKVLEGNYDHDFGNRSNGGKDKPQFGAHKKPDRTHAGKYAAIGRTFATDTGAGGAGPGKDSSAKRGVPDPPESPP